jgi:hypothetical protein
MKDGRNGIKEYKEPKALIATNPRNPSKYHPEEMLMVHFMKRGRTLMKVGELKEDRVRLH